MLQDLIKEEYNIVIGITSGAMLECGSLTSNHNVGVDKYASDKKWTQQTNIKKYGIVKSL